MITEHTNINSKRMDKVVREKGQIIVRGCTLWRGEDLLFFVIPKSN